MFPNVKIYGRVGKNSPTVLSRFWTKVHQIWRACREVPVDRLVSFRMLISYSVAETCSVKVQSRSQKAVFAPSPWWVNARGSLDQIFLIAVISEYVSKFGWDPFSDLKRLCVEKRNKERKNHSGKIQALPHRDAVWAKNGRKEVTVAVVCWTHERWQYKFDGARTTVHSGSLWPLVRLHSVLLITPSSTNNVSP